MGNKDGPSAYSPHVDVGLVTLVTCPETDRSLVVRRPDGGEERVPLEPGIAAILPGMSLSMVSAVMYLIGHGIWRVWGRMDRAPLPCSLQPGLPCGTARNVPQRGRYRLALLRELNDGRRFRLRSVLC